MSLQDVGEYDSPQIFLSVNCTFGVGMLVSFSLSQFFSYIFLVTPSEVRCLFPLNVYSSFDWYFYKWIANRLFLTHRQPTKDGRFSPVVIN